MTEARARPIDGIVIHSALTDGTRVCLRTIKPDDEERIRDGIARLSAESRYLRFFSPAPALPTGSICTCATTATNAGSTMASPRSNRASRSCR